MKARLVSKAGPLQGQSFEVSGDMTIGRSDSNDICLPSDRVSSQHARLSYDEVSKTYFFEDLGSLNGTELDGVKVTRKERLGRLHVLRFAREIDLIWQGPEVVASLHKNKAQSEGPPEHTTAVTLDDQLIPTVPANLAGIEPGISTAPIPPTPTPELASAAPPVPATGDASAAERDASSLVPDSPSMRPISESLNAAGGPIESDSDSAMMTLHDINAIDLRATLKAGGVGPSFDAQERGGKEEPDREKSVLSLCICADSRVKRVELMEGVNVIGSGDGVDIVMPGLDPQHAELRVDGLRTFCRVLDGLGSTLVNDQEFEGEVDVSEARVRFGETETFVAKLG